jgi:hypothetical protein
MVGAATVAAAPAAATFKKRRRVEVLSLVGAVMVFSPLDTSLWWTSVDLLAERQRLARVFGKPFFDGRKTCDAATRPRRASIQRTSCFIPGRIKFLLRPGRLICDEGRGQARMPVCNPHRTRFQAGGR